MSVLIIIFIVIFSIATLSGVVGILMGGAISIGITVTVISGLMLALSIYLRSQLKRKRNGARFGIEPQPVTQYTTKQQTVHIHISNLDTKDSNIIGRYCPYCGAEFDDNDDEVCPNCGGRTKKGRPEPQ